MSEPSQAQENQSAVNLYHSVFRTKDGKAVLDDLKKVFGTKLPAFLPLERGRHCEYDPTHAAIRDGQRSVVIHIEAQLEAKAKGDANIDPDKPKVRR